MIKWLAKRRLNYIDCLGIGTGASFISQGRWPLGIAVWLVVAVVSVLVEMKADRSGA
jgi:hypothetical protein